MAAATGLGLWGEWSSSNLLVLAVTALILLAVWLAESLTVSLSISLNSTEGVTMRAALRHGTTEFWFVDFLFVAPRWTGPVGLAPLPKPVAHFLEQSTFLAD
jgi:hypothetical protein